MKRHLYLAAMLVAAIVPAAASAQKTYAVGVGGGAAIPVGRLNDTQKSGYNGTVMLAIGVAELPLGLRLDGIFNQFSRRNVQSAQAGGAGAYSFRATGLLGNLIYAFPGTTAKPYLIAGTGLYSTKTIAAGAKSENHWGFNGGVGATFGLGPFATFIESRYHLVSRTPAQGGVIHFVPVTIGLLF